jgi:hypothetical protein
MHRNVFIAGIRQGVVIVLMALLALSPFLHGHLGASHVSGFHVDGLDLSHNVSDAATATWVSAHAVSEEESPALGVSVSLPLPQSGDDVHLAMSIVGFWLWLWLAKKLLAHGVRRTPSRPEPVPGIYQSGWPPPALAPPL